MCSLRYCIDFCYDIDTVGLTYEGVFQTCVVERIWVGLWFILLIGMMCLKNLNLTWLLLFQRWRKIGISSASVQFRGLWSSAGPTSTAAETCHAVCVLTGQFPPPSHRYRTPAEFTSAVMKREGDWYQWGNWSLQAGRRTVLDTGLLKYQCGWFIKVSSVLCVCLHKPKHCMRGWWRIINAPNSLFSCYHYTFTFKGEVWSWTFVCVCLILRMGVCFLL